MRMVPDTAQPKQTAMDSPTYIGLAKCNLQSNSDCLSVDLSNVDTSSAGSSINLLSASLHTVVALIRLLH